MADLYNYASQFTLGQLFRGGQNVLQGAANLLNQAGIGTRGTPLTGREKINKSWGMLGTAYHPAGGNFRYRTGNGKPYSQPSYADAQGNIYDAVSGRLLYPAKTRPGGGGGGGGNAGYSDPGFRPFGGTPGERAQAAETSRVAQLTAQDPELQRYEAARLKAVAPGATAEQVQSAEDIGMQMWQKKYGNTPMAQPGGAVGAFNPLMEKTFGYQSGSAPGQQVGAPTLGPSPLVPQIDQSLNPASPNYIGGEGAPLMNFADPRFENMSPEDFQKLLNQVNKK